MSILLKREAEASIAFVYCDEEVSSLLQGEAVLERIRFAERWEDKGNPHVWDG